MVRREGTYTVVPARAATWIAVESEEKQGFQRSSSSSPEDRFMKSDAPLLKTKP